MPNFNEIYNHNQSTKKLNATQRRINARHELEQSFYDFKNSIKLSLEISLAPIIDKYKEYKKSQEFKDSCLKRFSDYLLFLEETNNSNLTQTSEEYSNGQNHITITYTKNGPFIKTDIPRAELLHDYNHLISPSYGEAKDIDKGFSIEGFFKDANDYTNYYFFNFVHLRSCSNLHRNLLSGEYPNSEHKIKKSYYISGIEIDPNTKKINVIEEQRFLDIPTRRHPILQQFNNEVLKNNHAKSLENS